jgi:hypothetical protein
MFVQSLNGLSDNKREDTNRQRLDQAVAAKYTLANKTIPCIEAGGNKKNTTRNWTPCPSTSVTNWHRMVHNRLFNRTIDAKQARTATQRMKRFAVPVLQAGQQRESQAAR